MPKYVLAHGLKPFVKSGEIFKAEKKQETSKIIKIGWGTGEREAQVAQWK